MKPEKVTADEILAIGIARGIERARHKLHIRHNKRVKVEYKTIEAVERAIKKYHSDILALGRCSKFVASKDPQGDIIIEHVMQGNKMIVLALSEDKNE